MGWGSRSIVRAVLVAAAVAWGGFAYADEPLARLAALVEQNDYAGAWALAEELEPEHAGTPQFDLLYGLAAYHTGRHDRAVFAFERLAWQHPGDPRVRLGLARARFATGQDDRARHQLKMILAIDDLSPDAHARLEQRLNALEQGAAIATRPRHAAYIAGFLGYDSNVNSATAERYLSVPWSSAPVLVPDGIRERSSGFAELDVGGGIEHSATPRLAWFAQGRYRNRSNFETSHFDLDVVDASVGPSLRRGLSRYRLPVQFQTVLLDGSRYRDTVSVSGEWTRNLNDRQAIQLLVQGAQSRYRDQPERDSHMVTGGGQWVLRPVGWAQEYAVTVIAARETARRDAGEHLGRDLGMLRFSGRWPLWSSHVAHASTTALYARHHADDPQFEEQRRNRYLRLAAGWRWLLTENWRIEAEVSYADNASSIGFYEYEQTQAKVGIRHDFR